MIELRRTRHAHSSPPSAELYTVLISRHRLPRRALQAYRKAYRARAIRCGRRAWAWDCHLDLFVDGKIVWPSVTLI